MKKFKYNDKEIIFKSVSDYDHIHSNHNRGFYEIKLLNKIKSLNLGGLYLDVGANIGNHTVYMSMFTDAEKVYAFESHPKIFNVLENNIELNNLKNVILYNLGVSSSEKILKMAPIDYTNVGSTKISDNGVTKIQCNSLDNIMKDIDNISLIKFDIEGHELEALKGSVNIIEKHRPIIFAEAHGQYFEKINNYLSKFNYRTDKINYGNSPTFMWIYCQ